MLQESTFSSFGAGSTWCRFFNCQTLRCCFEAIDPICTVKKHKKCLKENVARVTEGICSINLVFPHEFHFVWDTRVKVVISPGSI